MKIRFTVRQWFAGVLGGASLAIGLGLIFTAFPAETSPTGGAAYVGIADTKQGGLFRLDIKGEGDNAEVTATKIVSLDRPTAIAFSPEGDAYVTAFGGGANDSGVLVKISGGL